MKQFKIAAANLSEGCHCGFTRLGIGGGLSRFFPATRQLSGYYFDRLARSLLARRVGALTVVQDG
jgi:hypothetical protein